MKEKIILRIRRGSPGPTDPFTSDPHISDYGIFNKLWSLQSPGLGKRGNPESENALIRVGTDLVDPVLDEVFQLLAEAGRFPWFGREVPHKLSKDHFHVGIKRTYEKSDVENARFLRFGFSEHCRNIARFVGRDGDRWVAETTEKSETLDIGSIGGSDSRFVSGRLKGELDRIRPRGIVFHPVRLTNDSSLRIWEVDSDTVLPACLTPTAEFAFDGKGTKTILYDDGCFFPAQLRYRKTDIDQIEGIDMVKTRESIYGATTDGVTNILFISQQFRQIVGDLVPEGFFSYEPIAEVPDNYHPKAPGYHPALSKWAK